MSVPDHLLNPEDETLCPDCNPDVDLAEYEYEYGPESIRTCAKHVAINKAEARAEAMRERFDV
jgi:hypothetical protein